MKRTLLSLLAITLCVAAQAISWVAPTLKTSDYFTENTSYYLYHVGRKQMLTYGAKWGTHAVLDSTEMNALPYNIVQTGYGYTLQSPAASNQGYLFRENTGTGVYTDYNNNERASQYWDITSNGNGTVTITTAIYDYTWGIDGYMVKNDEYAYRLGWNPEAQDVTKDNIPMGSNQSVYMLKPDNAKYETEWAFVLTTDYTLFLARKELYATAVTAAAKGIDYQKYTSVYNGTDTEAIVAATNELKKSISEGGEPDTELGELLHFALTDSSSMIFPLKYIEKREEDRQFIHLTLTGDTAITIAKDHIVSETAQYEGELPVFESFKFNNKFNDQLFTDAIGEIDDTNNRVTIQVGCIGKWLTPSFQLPEGAKAYINGKRQYSKQTRLRFDKPVTYTVAYPRQYLYTVTKVKDEVWSDPQSSGEQWISTKVALTETMLSTNAPTNHNDYLSNLLDGDHGTIFHSTWGTGQYTTLAWSDGSYYGDGMSEWPYLEVELPEALHRLQFEYTTRKTGAYAPLGLILQGSTDGKAWTDVQSFTADKDNLPTTPDATYLSPIVTCPSAYRYLRLQLTESQRKNYLVFSEFSLYKVEENPDYQVEEPTLLSPAEYTKGFIPYGRDYEVVVDFLTDHPTTEYNVPRIDIWFGDRETWSSSMWIGRNGKTAYEDATIKIDGAGVFPDMEETPVQIKGRGNSSWTNSYNSKNPYRLKFEAKQKPLGMTKGKSWVLLANKQSGSMTTNAVAMKIADMVESQGCNHIVPVELYVNNQYRGSYNFTEKVGFSNNSIDLTDESYATLLELDSYYDEAYKFRDSNYNLYVNVKEPDFSDAANGSALTFADVKDAFNSFTYDVKNYTDYAKFDVQSIVTAMFVNDLVRNEECKHPKSWFIYNENIMEDSLWNIGPVWDFDWAFGYEGTNTYFVRNAETDLFANMNSNNIGYPFFRQLLRGSDVVKKAYYRLWTEFMENGRLEELIQYCDDYFQYAQPSLLHNNDGVNNSVDYGGYIYEQTGWGDGRNYATVTTNAKSWLQKRANYIYSHLDKYDLSEDIIDPEEDDYGTPTQVVDLSELASQPVNVYTIGGVLVRHQVPYSQFSVGLQPGIYIVNGKKVAIR